MPGGVIIVICLFIKAGANTVRVRIPRGKIIIAPGSLTPNSWEWQSKGVPKAFKENLSANPGVDSKELCSRETGMRNEVWSQESVQGDKNRVWVTAENCVPLISI